MYFLVYFACFLGLGATLPFPARTTFARTAPQLQTLTKDANPLSEIGILTARRGVNAPDRLIERGDEDEDEAEDDPSQMDTIPNLPK